MNGTPPDLISSYDIVTGFFLPHLTAFILQSHWSTARKSVVSFVVMLLVALGSAWIQGRLQGQPFLFSMLTVCGIAIGSFKALWQPTGIAQQVESATTITRPTSGEQDGN